MQYVDMKLGQLIRLSAKIMKLCKGSLTALITSHPIPVSVQHLRLVSDTDWRGLEPGHVLCNQLQGGPQGRRSGVRSLLCDADPVWRLHSAQRLLGYRL